MACMAGGMCDGGAACMAGGACMARGHVWQGGMHGGGVCGSGGSMHGRGMHGKGGVHGRMACMVGGHAWHTAPPPRQMLQDTVNERALRILLECILVIQCFLFSAFNVPLRFCEKV